MVKFPEDVTTAETKTNGDPNIINDPIFLPEQKQNYSDIFRTPNKTKKTPKKSGSKRSSSASESLAFKALS